MGQSKFDEIVTTRLKDHWLMDQEYSDLSENIENKELVLDAINNSIKKIKSDESEIQTSINNEDITLTIEVPDILSIEKLERIPNYFKDTQVWVGYITEIYSDSFLARLEDKNESGTDESAIFEFKSVSLEDQKFIQKGAVFYWSVGYAVRNGTVKKESLLFFKRSVEFKERDYDIILNNADNFENITWI